MSIEYLYADVSHGMGYENKLMVIRSTRDWVLVKELEKSPQSYGLAHPPKKWMASGNRVFCLNRAEGLIEIEDDQGNFQFSPQTRQSRSV